MNIARKLLAALLCLPLLSLQACVEIVLDQAHLKADMPLAPPTMLPDSSSQSPQIQAGLRVSKGKHYDKGLYRWDDFPIAGSLQLQAPLNRHWRVTAGADLAEGASLWVGPIISTHTGNAVWEAELLVGRSIVQADIKGHYRDKEITELLSRDTLATSGFRSTTWGQFALRVRSAGSGPWLEGRVLPFRWGQIEDTLSSYFGSEPTSAATLVLSLASGWKWDLASGRMASFGARAVWVDKQCEVQLIAQWQRPLL